MTQDQNLGEVKRCRKCGAVKPLTDFYANSTAADGREGRCKNCSNAYNRAYSREHPESGRRRTAKHLREHPEQSVAHVAVRNALKSGELVRQPCEVCGDPDSEAHHEDYSKPLEVRWLCKPHHREADKARRAYLGQKCLK